MANQHSRRKLPDVYRGFRIEETPGNGVVVICPSGHREIRQREIVRSTLNHQHRIRCKECPPPASDTQLEVLRLLQSHQERFGDGMTVREIALVVGCGAKSRLESLETKGWVERVGSKRWLTDEGFDELAANALEGAAE